MVSIALWRVLASSINTPIGIAVDVVKPPKKALYEQALSMQLQKLLASKVNIFLVELGSMALTDTFILTVVHDHKRWLPNRVGVTGETTDYNYRWYFEQHKLVAV